MLPMNWEYFSPPALATSISGLARCASHGCTDLWSLAAYLDLPRRSDGRQWQTPPRLHQGSGLHGQTFSPHAIFMKVWIFTPEPSICVCRRECVSGVDVSRGARFTAGETRQLGPQCGCGCCCSAVAGGAASLATPYSFYSRGTRARPTSPCRITDLFVSLSLMLVGDVLASVTHYAAPRYRRSLHVSLFSVPSSVFSRWRAGSGALFGPLGPQRVRRYRPG